MYNKNYCSAAQNSSFWKRFLVRLLLQKKARWKKMGLTAVVLLQPPEKSTHNSVGQRHTCPLQQQSKRSSRNCDEAFFFLSASWHGHEAGSQEFTHRVSVCLTEHRGKKEKSLLYNREICCEWSKSTNAGRSRPLSPACRGGVGGQDGGRGVPETSAILAQAWWVVFLWRLSDMLQPLWHKYSTLHTASLRLLNLVK